MTYQIWEKEAAPDGGVKWPEDPARPKPYDHDWECWSYPIGNGYGGANLFGRTDTERIQISDKGLHNGGHGRVGSFTNFAEVYVEFGHEDVKDYRRSLDLDDAIARVSYTSGDVRFDREYFASYPDNVIVVRLTADRAGSLTFSVRTEIPYLDQDDERTGAVTAESDLLTLAGTEAFFHCNYEGQIRVLHQGGALEVDRERGTITVRDSDTATLLIATGTNYRLGEGVFTSPPAEKLDHSLFPHEEVSARIAAASALGYDDLKRRHLDDYRNLFGRVSVDLKSTPSGEPTSVLLKKYQDGDENTRLEELMFQYGRYLLISSSREKSLPANLQGAWTQYYWSPWTAGYWHNINVQMNYWGAMSANLAECFEGYVSFFKAILPKAREHATEYVRKQNPERLAEHGGDNGWIVGTGANAYRIGGPGGHSGPGTGGFTSKLFMEYYLFSRDKAFLKEMAYPVMRSLSVFYAKALKGHGDLLLVEPSASPENKATEEQAAGMPGHILEKGHYVTTGCTFDQGFVWENFRDTLILAEELGEADEFLETIRDAMERLDPIHVGADGQIKEYREEEHYSDLGDPKHRHISHLCPLYPGTLISSGKEAWMEAAGKTLDLRGDKTTGWAMAHRMNCRARLKQGDKARSVYRQFIQDRAVPNLWTLHPPFQIDGNFGTMAGVVEMLLQSHEGCIEVLPALPKAWETGSFKGLVARGNFVVDAEWEDGKVLGIHVKSRSGGICRIACNGIEEAQVRDGDGGAVTPARNESGRIDFDTTPGGAYVISLGVKTED